MCAGPIVNARGHNKQQSNKSGLIWAQYRVQYRLKHTGQLSHWPGPEKSHTSISKDGKWGETPF